MVFIIFPERVIPVGNCAKFSQEIQMSVSEIYNLSDLYEKCRNIS